MEASQGDLFENKKNKEKQIELQGRRVLRVME